MNCYGPKKWCSFIKEKVGDGIDVVVISLNPGKDLNQRIEKLRESVTNGKRVIAYSLTTRQELERTTSLRQMLEKVEFVQGPSNTVIEYLLYQQPR